MQHYIIGKDPFSVSRMLPSSGWLTRAVWWSSNGQKPPNSGKKDSTRSDLVHIIIMDRFSPRFYAAAFSVVAAGCLVMCSRTVFIDNSIALLTLKDHVKVSRGF